MGYGYDSHLGGAAPPQGLRQAGPNPRQPLRRRMRMRIGQILVVSYTAVADSFVAETPRPWSEEPLFRTQSVRNFDLHPDGERIVGVTARESTTKQNRVVFLFDFFERLRSLVPTN